MYEKLKIAIVYLHEEGVFEIWLAGSNRKLQKEYINYLKDKDIGIYKLSEALPGIDSIVESRIIDQLNFDQQGELITQIENKTMAFIKDMIDALA